MSFTGEQVVEILKTLPGILAAIASLIIALKAQRSARSAQRSAEAAHEKAAEAAREQLTFALRRHVQQMRTAETRAASAPILSIQATLPPGEGGTLP